MTIVCYGDSNTRYYLGDLQESGELELAYPYFLEQIFLIEGNKSARVHNCGYPDMQTDYGVEHFNENVLSKNADVCILGFGTNNIRQPDADLDRYISEMEALIDKCKANGIKPMALLIPWFSEDYCGKDGQDRISVWNDALAQLCSKHGVETLDTYAPFKEQPEKYFNEKSTAQRHYSYHATQAIAKMAYDRLK